MQITKKDLRSELPPFASLPDPVQRFIDFWLRAHRCMITHDNRRVLAESLVVHLSHAPCEYAALDRLFDETVALIPLEADSKSDPDDARNACHSGDQPSPS